MCGICGKLNFDRNRPVDAKLIHSMMDRIRHRGPDGAGHYVSGPVGLGHRRLSIIDLSTGDQPMTNEDGSVWVVFNGEIYNFKELRRELEQRGHRFRSTSDTEVIVHMYEEMGDACISRFRGMFAFALWDDRRQRLLLARDRVGIKPLYFTDTGSSVVFASEIKALLADPEVDRAVDYAAIDRFLTYYYLPGNGTLLEGIHKLEPGHYLTADSQGVSIRPYWDLQIEKTHPKASLEDSANRLKELLSGLVKDHMISDVPVGVLLSGGVDSTGILSFASSHAQTPLHTFTMGFDGAVVDERPFARLAAKTFGTEHHEVSMSAAEFRDFLPQYVWHMEEPVCEPPALALYFVARLARQCSVKVLLSGEGGDEAFAGYQDYRNVLLLERLKTGVGPLKSVLKAGFGVMAAAGWGRASHYASLVDRDVTDYFYSRASGPTTFFNRSKFALYNDGIAKLIDRSASDEPTRRLWKNVSNAELIDQLLYIDTKSWLPDDLLVKADKMTMAASVELRVPLLDHTLLEFAASLPGEHKVRGFQLKRVLRHALRHSVPDAILNRKKAGFPVPYARWLRGELRDFVNDTVLERGSFCDTHFSRETISNMLHEHHVSGQNSKEVFSLLVLQLWHRQFLQAAPIEPSAVRAATDLEPAVL
jgi:asparagine synthase (glutamine-hydrolysing)